MDKSEGKPKKCFCARCFYPIEPEAQVCIDGQNYHKMCSTCCICHKIPTSIRMYYGHVFCPECFKNYMLNRFKGGVAPCVTSMCNWWQWAPGANINNMQPQQDKDGKKKEETPTPDSSKEASPNASCKPKEAPKRCICARCLQACDENCKVDIGGQSYHPECARCCFCHCVPTNNVKIYYGKLFCEECFNNFILRRHQDNPKEFFMNCFEQWKNNPQVAETMTQFMASSGPTKPQVVLLGPQPPPTSNHCHEWTNLKEPAAAEATLARRPSTCDGSWTPPSSKLKRNSYKSANHDTLLETADEKIEKLTKYLHQNISTGKSQKKWKNSMGTNVEKDDITKSVTSEIAEAGLSRWTNLQDPKIKQCCPMCVWQCGIINNA